MTMKISVGTYHVREDRKVTENFECAAWQRELVCPAGSYPVYAYLDAQNVFEGYLGHSLYVPFEGRVSYATFQPLWCGSPIGRDRGSEEVGRMMSGSIMLGGSCLHRHVEAGDLELDERLVASREHTSDEGKTYTFYRLAHRPTGRDEYGRARWDGEGDQEWLELLRRRDENRAEGARR